MTIKEFYGKQIIFPDSLYIFDRNTIGLINSTLINKKEYKILTFISGDCTPCIQQLFDWAKFHDELEDYDNVQLFFIMQSVDHSYFMQMYRQNIPDNYSLVFDPGNDFIRCNKLPSEKIFQTILINSENRIIIIGNPIFNEKLNDLYIKTLN